MSQTDFKTFTVGEDDPAGRSFGVGDLRSILQGDDWRAAIDIDVEAPNESDAREIAQDIVEALSDVGDIDPVYTKAMCPDCGSILKGTREPGDTDTCRESGRKVELVEVPEEMEED